MGPSIPASAIVNILPNVISAGGSGLDLVGLILTNNAQVPIGVVQPFSSQLDVASYFGPLSTEATLATTYFAGYDGSTIKPAQLLFSQYASVAVPAYLRGGSISSIGLTALQALSGVLTVTVNGTGKTSSNIVLTGATSFSNAATIITAAFTSPGFAVTYDSVSGAFVFTNTATGAASTLTFASGTLSAGLNLTQVNGAVLSQGSDIMVPGPAMDAIIAITQNWVSFTTAFSPSTADKVLFAAWANGKGNRYNFVGHTSNVAATNTGDTTTFSPQIEVLAYSGTTPVYDPNNPANVAVFLMGALASLDFNATNGRATMAFRTGNIQPGVTNQTIGDHLIANGYNFVGSYATANQGFTFLYPGQISGPFNWIDSWICQVWLNNALQLALMSLLTTVGQVPYNADGYALIEAAMADPVNRALNFGAIRGGIPLSTLQAAEVNNAAGQKISDTLSQRGWFIKVSNADATVRAARGSPPINLWYTDGQSVQKIVLSSIAVQ